MYQEALKLAYKAHDGQLRKQSCVPYIVHPIRVANCFNDDLRKTIAILHDVIEDTDTELLELRQFGTIVMAVVNILSKKDEEKHFAYIKRVAMSELATEIKIADIVDNLSDTLSIQPESMIKRYNKSLKILLT